MRAFWSLIALGLTLAVGCGGDPAGNTNGNGPNLGCADPNVLIPDCRRIDWRAGVPGGIPPVAQVCPAGAPSVLDFGAVGDGVVDDAEAFQSAVDAADEGGAVWVPAGDYLLRSGVVIDHGVVLCGEGRDVSRLLIDADDTGIDIVVYDRGDWVAVASGLDKGATQLTVAATQGAGFSPGDYAELQQSNDWSIMDPTGEWEHASWVPEAAVGQMVQITAVDGDVVTVDPPLLIDYDPGQDPQLRRVGLVSGAGLQSLYLTRLDPSDNHTVIMKNAVGCWMRDVESDTTCQAHVSMTSALWCEVRDSYLHDSHDHGGGGHGYGASLGSHVTASLVENNVFVSLRHSMIIQVGASGNVFGYNYSREPYQSEGGDWTPCDISLHGHYPSMNLFEGNTVQEIDVADYWGPCGPGNTFFRNRVEAEGIDVLDHSHGQNIVGNELSDGDNVITVEETSLHTFVHGNYVEGAVSWDASVNVQVLPASLYLAAPPPFLGAAPWPPLGADLAPHDGVIPAEQRWRDGAP
ncbi:MAG: glycosyl hydrolase family 28-related protein [bacterium]